MLSLWRSYLIVYVCICVDLLLLQNRLTGDEPNATYENFTEDIVALQQIAKNFADVNPEDLVGMRAPYLKTEGDGRMIVTHLLRIVFHD